MKTTFASLSLAALGCAFLAAPASALPVTSAPSVGTGVHNVQFFENLERAGQRGLKTMQRNSDRREPASTGTTVHPNRPAVQDIYSNQVSGGDRARNRR
ncbi:hypothetical protein [Salinarimonas soli]|uniref:DUF4148 domain-containing protein n=1 Tax=Salinarimonas soli TaxID=1638099 RepID=A0A5B2VC53_9HYPH|nr:hypothetical protein [Salinarimonas soli]KAA2237023.1 hypothetical protein F0L46_12195 [Salinarimonas soli]